MLDVVVIYRDRDLCGGIFCSSCKPDPICFRHCVERKLRYFPRHLWVLWEMHKARKFRLVFCVDVYGCMVEFGMQLLESAVREEEVNRGFEYLTCGPAIVCERRSICTRVDDYYTGATDWAPASAL